MQVEVGLLARVEVAPASKLLARAFADDPIITHYLKDGLRNRVALPAFFRAVLEEILPAGHVYAAHNEGKLVGVAAWMPPDPPELRYANQVAANLQKWIVRIMFPCASRQLFAGFAALEQFHPSEPHWYLAFVGVEPLFQTHGVGQAILSPVLKIAEETGASCYLETPFPRTYAFYERLGFNRQNKLNPWVGAPQGVLTFLK